MDPGSPARQLARRWKRRSIRVGRVLTRWAPYRRMLNMTLADWFRHHQKEVVFDQCKWMGVTAYKNPLDAWIYQEILHEVRPQTVIEIGSWEGGSTLFLAHMMDLMGTDGRIVSVDIDHSRFSVEHERIRCIEGDCTAPEILAELREICGEGSVLVLHDGDHRRHKVLEDLEAYAPLVTKGSYLIVEDGFNDFFEPAQGIGTWEEGPLLACDDFIAKHPEFRVDESRERYLATCNPRGFLERIG